jgi:hypothetical protein
VGAPTSNGRFVSFSCPPLGLLARPAEFVENLPDVRRMIVDTERLKNHLGNSWTGPKIGAIAGLSWAFQQDLYQSLLLLWAQTRRAARMLLGLQGL